MFILYKTKSVSVENFILIGNDKNTCKAIKKHQYGLQKLLNSKWL